MNTQATLHYCEHVKSGVMLPTCTIDYKLDKGGTVTHASCETQRFRLCAYCAGLAFGTLLKIFAKTEKT